MKFGAHSYLFLDRWSDKEIPLLDQVRELGVEMFEISVGDDVLFDPRQTGARAAALGIDLFIGPGGAWPLEADLSSDDSGERSRGLAWHKHQVDIASELGAVAYAGALYGHPGTVKRRRPPPDEYSHAAEGLHHLGEYAKQKGVVIALEPMSHFRTHLVNNPAQLLRLMAMADHENLRVLFDTYHIVTEIRDYGAALRALEGKLFALHACENDRGVPGGGLVPWDTVFRTLHETGFDGYVALEGYNSSLGDFAFERAMFHNLCPDGPAFVRKGLAFLKEAAARAGYRHERPPRGGESTNKEDAP
jgi:D-psicose/D-tagatose/L-ribulose 3-epimerase